MTGLETKFVGDSFKMLLTVLAILVTNVAYLFSIGCQHPKDVTKILI